jgi:hypothetical protein
MSAETARTGSVLVLMSLIALLLVGCGPRLDPGRRTDQAPRHPLGPGCPPTEAAAVGHKAPAWSASPAAEDTRGTLGARHRVSFRQNFNPLP